MHGQQYHALNQGIQWGRGDWAQCSSCREEVSLRWLGGITDSTDLSLSKLRETLKDREAWQPGVLQSMGSQRVTRDLAIEQQWVSETLKQSDSSLDIWKHWLEKQTWERSESPRHNVLMRRQKVWVEAWGQYLKGPSKILPHGTDSRLYMGICVCVCVFSHSVVSNSLWPHGLQPTRLLCPWDSPRKNTVVGCHFPLQGSFLTQGSKPCLLCWQPDSLPLHHQGSPSRLYTLCLKLLSELCK